MQWPGCRLSRLINVLSQKVTNFKYHLLLQPSTREALCYTVGLDFSAGTAAERDLEEYGADKEQSQDP